MAAVFLLRARAHSINLQQYVLGSEAVGQRIIVPHYVRGIDFSRQIALLEVAGDIVVQLVKSLRAGMNPKSIKGLVDELQSLKNS